MDGAEEPWNLRGKDVADILGCAVSQVYRYSRAGKLPYILTVGKQRRYRQSDVDRLRAGTSPHLATSELTTDERLANVEDKVTDLAEILRRHLDDHDR